MSDLISRDELLSDLSKWKGLNKTTYEAVVETIQNQQTAYDVDKVIKALEKYLNWEWENDDKSDAIGECIEIVKRGGKEC